jgi:hypothetical protein
MPFVNEAAQILREISARFGTDFPTVLASTTGDTDNTGDSGTAATRRLLSFTEQCLQKLRNAYRHHFWLPSIQQMLANANNYFLVDFESLARPAGVQDADEVTLVSRRFIQHLIRCVHGEYLQTMQAAAAIEPTERQRWLDEWNALCEDCYRERIFRQCWMDEQLEIDKNPLINWRTMPRSCSDLVAGQTLRVVFSTALEANEDAGHAQHDDEEKEETGSQVEAETKRQLHQHWIVVVHEQPAVIDALSSGIANATKPAQRRSQRRPNSAVNEEAQAAAALAIHDLAVQIERVCHDACLLLLAPNPQLGCCAGELELVYSNSKATPQVNIVRTRPKNTRIPMVVQGPTCAVSDRSGSAAANTASKNNISQFVVGKQECSLVCRIRPTIPTSCALHRYAAGQETVPKVEEATAVALSPPVALNKQIWLIAATEPHNTNAVNEGTQETDDRINPELSSYALPPPWWLASIGDFNLQPGDEGITQDESLILAVQSVFDYVDTEEFQAKTDQVHEQLAMEAVLSSSKSRGKEIAGAGTEMVFMHRALVLLWQALPPAVTALAPCIFDPFVRTFISSTRIANLKAELKKPKAFHGFCKACVQRAALLFQIATTHQGMETETYLARLAEGRASMSSFFTLGKLSAAGR